VGWRKNLPLWAFTGLHFVWQSTSWVRSMRYQMLIYPLLALFAGWGLVQLWSARHGIKLGRVKIRPKAIKIAGIILTVAIILGTAVWAFAFSQIYPQPHTRAAASRWVYQNIPGALTLHLETSEGPFQQPLPYRAGDTIQPGQPFYQPFISPADGLLSVINFPQIMDSAQTGGMKLVALSIISPDEPGAVLASARVESEFLPTDSFPRGMAYDFILDTPLRIRKDALYYLQLSISEAGQSLMLNGSPSLTHDE
jgi:hypothetical protein